MRVIYRIPVLGLLCGPSAKTTLTSILIAASLLLVTPLTVRAATYSVCALPLICDYESPEEAVNDPGIVDGDTIDITTGTYVLSTALLVDHSITILANGSVFDANGTRAIDVFDDIASPSLTNLSLTNVTIRNGQAGAGQGGGALRVTEGSVVTIINGIFENNQADYGGAVYNDGSTVNLRESLLSGNLATAGDGGAVLTEGGGVTNLTRTGIDGNQADVAGGGLAVANNNSQINLIESTISNNAAFITAQTASNPLMSGTTVSCGNPPHGAKGQTFIADASVISVFEFRIRLYGGDTNVIPNDLYIAGRVRQGGHAGPVIGTATAFAPGGVWPGSSTQTLTFILDQPVALIPGDTYAIEGNIQGSYSFFISPGDDYPGGSQYGCGGGLIPGWDLYFRTLGGSPVNGSGIHASDAGVVDLFNSTVSGNIGDGLQATDGGTGSILFSTITNNSGAGFIVPFLGEGREGFVSVTASIVAGNGGSDCDGDATSGGYNLIGDDSNCTAASFNGDMFGTPAAPVDPILGPLQSNGGWTLTHALDPNSPARDGAGADVQGLPCFDADRDQRGVARPGGAACDIGAFEIAPSIGPLQTQINAAVPGSIIDVPDGNYLEPITIGDGKTLRGSDLASVVIDASGSGASAIIATGDFNLENISVIRGESLDNGGAIIANTAGTDIGLINVLFDSNDALQDGGAIYLSNGTISGTNVTFTSNHAGGNGGAIAAGAGSTITIDAMLFEGNNATTGGAIFNGGSALVTDTTFNANNADVGGGAYNGAGGSLDIRGSTFFNNSATDQGGVAGGAIASAGTVDIRNSTFSGNTANLGNGGAIGLTAGSANLNNVTLAFNTAAGLGGAFHAGAGAGALISFSNSLLSDNTDSGTNCATVKSLGFNLFQNAPCPTTTGDIVSEPLIGFLASNGGPTRTHALQSLSPAIDAGQPVPGFTQFDAGNISLLQTQGSTTLDGGTLLLSSNPFNVGSAFVPTPINPGADFSAQFQFLIVPDVGGAADGITFTISDDPTVLGQNGGFLGIGATDPIEGFPAVIGIVTGVSVEFDTWLNGQAEGANDPGPDHIGIDINGSLSSVAMYTYPSQGVLSDGNIWSAWIDYDATTNNLEVRAANNGVRPALATVSAIVDIEFLTGPNAYVGFTGATGSAGISGEQRILSFSFNNSCESVDQRGELRPDGGACDIGAYEGAVIPLQMGNVVLKTTTPDPILADGMSYPGVVRIPIIDIPIEKLTGDSFNSPSSAPLGSFPIGSFPIGSFDLQSSPIGSFPIGSFPIGSFPIGSFPIGSFPIGSFPLSSIPLLSTGGWSEVLNDIPELAGAPLQTVTFEQLLMSPSFPGSVEGIELRDLAIQGSPLGSFSLPGMSLGDTTVAELDEWASNAGEPGTVCGALAAAEEDPPFTPCDVDDTLLSLEYKGAPVSALSLSSLPLGSFPIGSFPIGSFPIGSFPLGSFPIGSFPIGSFPIGSFPIGSFPIGSFRTRSAPLGSFPIGSFPLGSFNLLVAPTRGLPLGSFPIGSFPLGSFEIDGKSFCQFYDEQALADSASTCSDLSISPATSTLADLVAALQREAELADDTTSGIDSTPLGSFPIGSFPIGSFPIGSFPIGSFDLNAAPLSELTLGGFDGCAVIASNSDETCSTLGLNNSSGLSDVADLYGGSLAASPLGSFPIGSFGIADLPIGSFPIGSFEVNGAPLGSFPLGSFDLIGSPLGSFPIGSFPIGSFPPEIVTDPTGLCNNCQTLADAAKAGVINPNATLTDLAQSSWFATTTLGEVLDAMTLAMLYGTGTSTDPSTLADIEDTGNLTLGQLLIAMMLKTDFPWETIPLAKLDAQSFSPDHFVDYSLDIPLTGTDTKPFAVAVTIDEGFLYRKGSSGLDVVTPSAVLPTAPLSDPAIVDNGDGTQTLSYDLILGGFSNNKISFETVPPLNLGHYPANAVVQLGTNVPVDAENADSDVTVIPDPATDVSDPDEVTTTEADQLILGFIDTPDDNDYYRVAANAAGERVAIFMSTPGGDNDLIMYEPLSTIEAKRQGAEGPALDSIPFEDDGVNYLKNVSEEPNALEDVNLAAAPLASISTNRGSLDELVSAVAGNTDPFTIQVSGYNGALSVSNEPYSLRVKITPEVPTPQCSSRTWPGSASPTVLPAGEWTTETNAVFLVNGARLAASDPNGAAGADAALTAINRLIGAPGIVDGVVVDVSGIFGVDYTDWDSNPCDVAAANTVVNAIATYLEEQRATSSDLAYVTIVGSDEVIPFARKPDETSIANESTFASEFSDNAMYGSLVTRHFLSDDVYGDIDPIAWLDRYLNVPELGVGRLVESASDIETAALNYIASLGVLDPQTALSAGYDFIADASQEINETFIDYAPDLGYNVVEALIDLPDVTPATAAWSGDTFLERTGVNTTDPVDLVSFNMHFDFDEALPSIGDASEDYSDSLISVADFAGADLTGGIWFTVGCHSGTNVADVSVVGGAPSEDWAQTFGRLGALYLAQNAYGLGDTEAVALTERLMANFARNLNGRLTIGQAHAFAKQQYFADLGLYGEYDYKALQAATLFGLPMYRYGVNAMPPASVTPPLPVVADPLSGLVSASWSLPDTDITQTFNTSKGDLFSVKGEVQFVHFRPLQPIVRTDVTGPNGEVASGAFLTGLTTEDIPVADIAFARPVIDLGANEPEVETDEVVFPTAFTNIANYKAPPLGGGPFTQRQQLNVIVGQFTSPLDGRSSGTERLFRSIGTQIFYRPATPALTTFASPGDEFIRPEFDNVQANVVESTGSQQASFSVDASDNGTVLRVAVLYLQSVDEITGEGSWALAELVQSGGSNTWTGGGQVELSGIADGQIDYMVQAVDDNGNVANSTFKGLFYVAKKPIEPPESGGGTGSIGVVVRVDGVVVDPGSWITSQPVQIEVTGQDPESAYEYSVDFAAFATLPAAGFQITTDGVHTVTIQESGGGNPVTFGVLVDTAAPRVLITTPQDGGFIVQGDETASVFDCLDAGSGIASCDGPVADGAPVPAPSTGSHSFAVTAQDYAQNPPRTEVNTYYVVQPIEIGGSFGPAAVSDTVSITASATDLAEFSETVTIDWGDGSAPEMVDLGGGSVSSMSSDHIYVTAGIYQVTVMVDYEGQYTQVGVFDSVSVFDPNHHVSGHGEINSPSGAYTPNDPSDPDITAKVSFDFEMMYKLDKGKKGKKDEWVPDGMSKFNFVAANLKLDAVSYDWMITSGPLARFKGEARVKKGGGNPYQFLVTVLDADAPGAGFDEDRFRIRIWQEDASGSETVIYDNGLGVDDTNDGGGTTPLSKGLIELRSSNGK